VTTVHKPVTCNEKIRPGFTLDELNQYSKFTQDLSNYGFRVPPNTSGRFFCSDTSTAAIAHLQTPLPNPKGLGHLKYCQTPGEGRFFKLFKANQSDTIVLCEGIYDACAVWTQGHNAIAYSGIAGAFIGSKVHPDLLKLLQGYQKVVIGYDQDQQLTTLLYAEHHVLLLAKALEETEIDVVIIQTWNRVLGKDFNEILVNHSDSKLTEVLNNTVKIFDWKGISAVNAYTPTHTEHTVYVTQSLMISLIEQYKVLFVKAPMGSGKSNCLSTILKKFDKLGCLIISPLKALGRQITKTIREHGVEIYYRDDIDASSNWERIVCCLESISVTGKLKIKADGSQLHNKILIIDEIVQVIGNLLDGSTISKARAEVVALLTAILRCAQKCIFLSADLTDYHCNVIRKLLGDTITDNDICKYENTLPRNTFNGYLIGSIQQGISFVLNAFAEGKRIFLGIDSQKTTSTYGTGNIAELFSKGGELYGLRDLPKDKILVIDSATSTNKDHEAYAVTALGNKAILQDKQLVIVSPSVEAGLSFNDDEYSPDLALLCHLGCTTPLGIVQLSMRLRNLDIPRFFCFGGHVSDRLECGGAINKGQVKSYINRTFTLIKESTNAKFTNKLLHSSKLQDIFNLTVHLDVDDLNLQDEYAQLKVIKNLQLLNREFIITTALRTQGANIQQIDPSELGNYVRFKKDLLAIKETRIHEEAYHEFLAPTLTDKEAEALKEQQALTATQQYSMSKFFAQKTYRFDDVTQEELVDKKKGLLEPEEMGILLNEGREFVEFLEQERILRHQEIPLYNSTQLLETTETTPIYKPDIIKGAKAYKIQLAENLGFKTALDYALQQGIADLWLNEEHNPIRVFVENIKRHKHEWCLAFGWRSRDFTTVISIFEHTLKEFGYKFTEKTPVRIKVNVDGTLKTKKITIYKAITSSRNQKSRAKRSKAYINEVQARYNKFIETQLFVTIGHKLIANEPLQDILNKFDSHTVLEAAKRLPRKTFGLSKYSEIILEQNNFNLKLDVPKILITEKNIHEFTEQIQQWINQKTEIGFDTETYASAIHHLLCEVKNDKWYWHNPQTNKRQQIKPGLDQNFNQIRLIQLSDGEKTYVLDLGRCDAPALPIWFRNGWLLLKTLCSQNLIVGHNLKFDTSSIRKYGLIIKNPYCTLVTTQLAFGDCGAGKVLPNGYGLKSVAHNLLGLNVDKTEQFSNWGAKTLTETQINYAATDAILTLQIKKRLELILENPTLWGFKEFATEKGTHANAELIVLENKNIYHTTEMQWQGVPCDPQKVTSTIQELENIRNEIEEDWKALKMPCSPQQAKKIAEELNRRYIERNHPFEPAEFAEALGYDVDNPNLELPTIDKAFTSTAKDVINDNSELPELMVLKAWRAFNTAITQLSKVLLSVQINNGICRTEYKPLSGTGRMACGNEYGLGTPNLQAFVKKAEGKYFGFIPASNDSPGDSPKKFWEKPSISKAIGIRNIFALTDNTKAFFTEDANASHARLAVGFGKCEFGRAVLQDENMDAHSMFAMLALQAMLQDTPNCLDAFPQIRDFVSNLSGDQVRKSDICKQFKTLDATTAGTRFRSAAKTLFYSVLNGAQADKMRKVLAGACGTSVSVAAGTAMFDMFWNLYQGIGNYIKQVLTNAEANYINIGGIEYNITTLPDGVKLLYARKDGDLATTNIIACQWSRCEASALKKVMAYIETIPKEYQATLVNMVHDEVGVTCSKEYWENAYKLVSDQFAKEYNVYLKDFIPCDQPTELKLLEKTHDRIPVIALNADQTPVINDKGIPEIIYLTPSTENYSVKINDKITSTRLNKNKKIETKEVQINIEKCGFYWTLPDTLYIPTSWADK